MKLPCLSLWSPWSHVIFCMDEHGVQLKKDETRGWPLAFRGRIAIHAAKSLKGQKYIREEELPRSLSWRENYTLGIPAMKLGCILGTVDIVACYKTQDIRDRRSETQLFWGDYRNVGDNSKQRYAFELANPILLPEPIPYRGQQGFFTVELQ